MGIVIDERDERDVVDEVADDESDAFGEWHEDPDEGHTVARLRATLAWVVGLNFGYFFIEMTVALLIGSVSLFADSVDFLEDTAVNALILLALGWSLAHRAKVGRVMAVIIVMPAVAAIWQAISKVATQRHRISCPFWSPPAALSSSIPYAHGCWRVIATPGDR